MARLLLAAAADADVRAILAELGQEASACAAERYKARFDALRETDVAKTRNHAALIAAPANSSVSTIRQHCNRSILDELSIL